MKITIIGFGNIAHALVANLGSKKDVELFIYTSSDIDSKMIYIEDSNKKGEISKISNDLSEILSVSDLIIFTTPSYVRKDILKKIAPYVIDKAIIGAFPGIGGFYDEVKEILDDNITIFASQRVPYIARIKERGKLVNVVPKNSINVAISKNEQKVQEILYKLLDMKINILDNFMEVHLTNSNPILHSARLYSLFESSTYPFEKEILFYEEWDDKSSEILLDMDKEFMKIVQKLNLNITSLQEHYDVCSIKEMTNKIKSIDAFKNIKTPLIKINDKFVFDINSRYFQEDIKHDLAYILQVANYNQLKTPIIENVYQKLNLLIKD